MSINSDLIRRLVGLNALSALLIPALRWTNRLVRAVASASHRLQFLVEWGLSNPEYFDHNIDLFSSWHRDRESFPMERGVFSSIAISNGATVLDLCCGDGFYAYYFFSSRATSVVAVDMDKEAIRWAKRNYRAPNLSFVCGDIRDSFPIGRFDNIVWDAAIEHFTEDEITQILSNIRTALTPTGVLSGYTIVKSEKPRKHLEQHEYEFSGKEDLARVLTPHFGRVQIFETKFSSRSNLYFHATNQMLPLDQPALSSVFKSAK